MIRPIVAVATITSLLLVLAFSLFADPSWGDGCMSTQEPIRRGNSCRLHGG